MNEGLASSITEGGPKNRPCLKRGKAGLGRGCFRGAINAIRNKIIHRITSVVERQTPYVAYATTNC